MEFSLKNIDRKELLDGIDNTAKVVETSLNTLDERSLGEEYPILVFDEKTSTGFMLVHLATHLTYHLGQINYHRRIVDRAV